MLHWFGDRAETVNSASTASWLRVLQNDVVVVVFFLKEWLRNRFGSKFLKERISEDLRLAYACVNIKAIQLLLQ